MKKVLFFALAITLLAVGYASAAQNVANTTQKGSLLIFPKILIERDVNEDVLVDTYITIANDYFQEVWVKCYWVDSSQNIEDFMFRLTPNQPIYFAASDGEGGVMTVPPFGATEGELKCWAVNASGDQQISWNHLYGYAAIVSEAAYAPYNAWSFTARGVALGNAVGTGGNLQLTGNTGGYDACPLYLVTNFYPTTTDLGVMRPDLTLAPCKEDLRQDRTPTCTKAKFDIWNENETKFTGAYVCIKCWAEGFLDDIHDPYGFGGEKFTWQTLKTDIARFRVQSANNAACKAAIKECAGIPGVLTPFVGLMLYAEESDAAPNFQPIAAYEPFTAGADGSGFVLWDASGGTPEAPKQ